MTHYRSRDMSAQSLMFYLLCWCHLASVFLKLRRREERGGERRREEDSAALKPTDGFKA